jgi:ABC-2 type transport system ATP-binding protein
MIEVTDLVVDRGRRTVLNGFSCTVPTGSVTGLLGPSGSGKTTLMRAIVGVQVVRSGSVKVLGLDAGSAALRHKIGYLTQAPSIYADLTVKENARYFASLYGQSAAEADGIVANVGLASAADQLVDDLSGGQRSRVGQDPVLRDELWAQFRGLAAAGTTILVSSHVMDEANRCDRLLLIREGELIADDTPAAVKESAGTDDLDQAFLTLIRRHGSSTSDTSPTADPEGIRS